MLSRASGRLLLAVSMSLIPLLSLGSQAQGIDDIRSASVPGLSVRVDGQTGVVHYIVIQIGTRSQSDGPVVQFSEINLGGGSLVGDDWKESVKYAMTAVLRQLGIEGRNWMVTIKNRSYNAMTDGMSASGAVAVGILAAWRGGQVRPEVAMTGQITLDGKIVAVGHIPQKLEAAARERFKTVLVPRGQLQTPEWDLTALAAQRQVTVMEVGTLEEAYEAMVRGSR
ncbi:MAG TPA: S16 family serine protease [Nitrospira sp.]